MSVNANTVKLLNSYPMSFITKNVQLRKSGTKKSKKKLKTLSYYKKKLWKLYSEWVRRSNADWKGMESCVSCGVYKPWKEMQAGHFVSKARGNAVYFEDRNVHPQCYRCNVPLKGNISAYAVWMEKKYGYGIIQELEELSHTTIDYTREDYIKMIDKLKDKLKCLN